MRGALRQSGWRFMVTGIGGALLIASKAGARRIDERLGAGGRIAGFPVAVPVGLAVAYVLDRRRHSLVRHHRLPLRPRQTAWFTGRLGPRSERQRGRLGVAPRHPC